MSKQIGSLLARTFREVCEESNNKVKADYNKLSTTEIKQFEDLLKKVDRDNFDFVAELNKLLKITE